MQKTANESDSSKVEVVGKKLLLLPNFDQSKHGLVTAFNGSPSAAPRALSLAVGCFPSKLLYLSDRRLRNRVLVYVSSRKKTADGARFSPTA